MSHPNSSLHGCYIANVTPFDEENRLDVPTLARHSAWLVDAGAHGLCPAGTTGEFLYLTESEKRLVVETAIDAVEGGVPVIAGVWGFTLEEVIRLGNHAAAGGAAGIFLPPPIYYPASDSSIFQWYSAIHNAVELPLFAYNIPQYAANSISFECLDRLFGEGIIAGVKDSTGKEDRVCQLVERYTSQGIVFAASDGFASDGRRIGAAGFISAIGNVMPRTFAKLWGGDDSLQPLVDEIRSTLKSMGSIAAIKYLLSIQGFEFGGCRIPCSDLTTEQKAVLEELSRTLAAA